jgi:hypothetical protein
VLRGAPAVDNTRYRNRKAELTMASRDWVLKGGKLLRHDAWNQTMEVKYKRTSDRYTEIMGKKEMMKRGVPSPNVADAFANSFAAPLEKEKKPRYKARDDRISEYQGGDVDNSAPAREKFKAKDDRVSDYQG